jgi:hypothetical protein
MSPGNVHTHFKSALSSLCQSADSSVYHLITLPAQRPSESTMSTSWKHQDDYDECFIGERMSWNNGKTPKPANCKGDLQTCLLCNRDFCDKHKAEGSELSICEINHASYYSNHPQLAGRIWPDMVARERAMASHPSTIQDNRTRSRPSTKT